LFILIYLTMAGAAGGAVPNIANIPVFEEIEASVEDAHQHVAHPNVVAAPAAIAGPLDQAQHLAVVFAVPPQYAKRYLDVNTVDLLVTQAQNGDVEITDEQLAMQAYAAFCFGYLQYHDISATSSHGLAMIAFQSLGPAFQAVDHADQDARELALKKSAAAIRTGQRGIQGTCFPGFADNWAAEYTHTLNLYEGGGANEPDIPLNADPTQDVEDVNGIPVETAIHIIGLAARHLKTPSTLFTQIYSYFYLAIPKRGNVSQKKLEDVCNEIQTATGKTITVDTNICELMYRYAGKHVNDANAGGIFVRWAGMLEADTALRSRLACQQAAQSGLTALCTIKKAITTYGDFNWGRVMAWFGEAAAVREAFIAVNNNPYFGFRGDLGNAKSSRYRQTAFVAKELLIRLAGMQSLRRYQGWARSVTYNDAVIALIERYVTAFTERVVEDDLGDDAIGVIAEIKARASTSTDL
jgi:hypothetical protein